MTVYYRADQIVSGAFPAMLAIGDSWFWYPKVSNLLAEISAVVKPAYSNIMAHGYIGARLEEYVNGKYHMEFARELTKGNLEGYSAVLISGGGNDAVDWGFCLKEDCSQEATAAGCLDNDKLNALMSDLGGWLLAMINEIGMAYEKENLRRPDIFVHCYAYAPPNGKGFELPAFHIPLNGPWLKPAMNKHLVRDDYELRKEIVRLLIDRMAETFAEFESSDHRVYVVLSQTTLNQDSDWDNELHPNGGGFQKLVHGPWLARLREAGYAA